MSIALLDVNFLLALLDPVHIHHDEAHRWFRVSSRGGWATCPLVQNGCIRVASQPGYKRTPASPGQVARVLQALLELGHEFWPDSVSLLDDTLFDLSQLRSGKQLTDVYLLGLAVRRAGHLVTFDRSIPLKAVKGATPSNLKVLGGSR